MVPSCKHGGKDTGGVPIILNRIIMITPKDVSQTPIRGLFLSSLKTEFKSGSKLEGTEVVPSCKHGGKDTGGVPINLNRIIMITPKDVSQMPIRGLFLSSLKTEFKSGSKLEGTEVVPSCKHGGKDTGGVPINLNRIIMITPKDVSQTPIRGLYLSSLKTEFKSGSKLEGTEVVPSCKHGGKDTRGVPINLNRIIMITPKDVSQTPIRGLYLSSLKTEFKSGQL